MAGTRALRSVSKSSPASGKSTPKARSTRNSRGGAAPSTSSSRAATQGKSSPYFSKTASSPLAKTGGRASNGKKPAGKAEKKTKAAVEYDSATGLTETEDEDESEDDEEASEDEFDPDSDEDAGAEEEEVDSDDIDEPSEEEDEEESEEESGRRRKGKGIKRKALAPARVVNGSGKKPKWKEEEEEGYADIELEEGQEIAGRIYPAPKTGQGRREWGVPPGLISQNTLNFLANLQDPERNDREWFKSHEPSFRQAEKEFKDFVGLVQEKFHEADDEIPILPPKDIIHRIYRDVRFSSDKTPYKKNFSMSTSRGGRKGIWAGYYLAISPNENSLIAAGVWAPDKNEIANIRHSILTDPQAFRDVIGAPAFTKLFGPAKEHPKGKRQNVFGHEGALKTAPKGVDKTHKDIDLLKLRSVAVVHHFKDDEVVAKNFQEKIHEIVEVMAPFVHKLNDMIALPAEEDDDEGEGEDGDEED